MSSTSGKSRLASSTADLTLFLSPQGVTRDCWSRLQESTTAVFGAPDIAEEKATVDEYESGNTEEKVVFISLIYSNLYSMPSYTVSLSAIKLAFTILMR